MERLQKYLSDSFQLSDQDWILISENIKTKTLEKGSFFIEQNKVCKNSGIILKGVMRYFSYDEKGNDPTCYFVCEDQYVTDPFTFKKQIPADMNLQAVTQCEIAVISYDADIRLQAALPGWADITNQMLLDVSINFANQKELLSMNATKRYDYFMENYPIIARRVPLQYVASYLGIKQQSLSRVRKNNSL
jgi:CRP-like cAMP-binding protein